MCELWTVQFLYIYSKVFVKRTFVCEFTLLYTIHHAVSEIIQSLLPVWDQYMIINIAQYDNSEAASRLNIVIDKTLKLLREPRA